jgi:hypothetical protein
MAEFLEGESAFESEERTHAVTKQRTREVGTRSRDRRRPFITGSRRDSAGSPNRRPCRSGQHWSNVGAPQARWPGS